MDSLSSSPGQKFIQVSLLPRQEGNSDNSLPKEDLELLHLLAKLAIQRCVTATTQTQIWRSATPVNNDKKQLILATIESPYPSSESHGFQDSFTIPLPSTKDDGQQRDLLDSLFPNIQSEMVEMVSSDGKPLVTLPRTLVHKFNILHRGVGVMICDGGHLTADTTNPLPNVYVHQRTSFKRIFPSLFDMFVGGVSESGEEARLTAAREVSEELGLKNGMEILGLIPSNGDGGGNGDSCVFSEPLFQCTVCTSYNRCVVTCFTYCFDKDSEEVKWQEEEVAWGAFIPYTTVQKAAQLSINRLKDDRKWPGTGMKEQEMIGDMAKDLPPNMKRQQGGENDRDDWISWDFVPDGLLVWEAWEEWRRGRQ